MAMMKYGTSTNTAANTTLKEWGQVKQASNEMEEEEERKKAEMAKQAATK
jgi:hypothetical protein